MKITPALIAKKLNAAADLLETKGWTKGTYARDAHGESCQVTSRKATCFCLDGALRRVLIPRTWKGRMSFEMKDALCLQIEKFLGIQSLIDWNDTRRSAKPVIAALRGAAKQVLADA